MFGLVWFQPSAVDGDGGGRGEQTVANKTGQSGTNRDTAAVIYARIMKLHVVKNRIKSARKRNEISFSEAPASQRRRRSSLTHVPIGQTPLQVQYGLAPSAFGVQFYKCAQMISKDEITFFLLIHNVASAGVRSNLSQVAVRDSISGIVPVKSGGQRVEKGYQSFTIDALDAGSQVVLNYTAHVTSMKSGVLDLPAFLTFSNASQNDVNMFGPLTANLTLRINSTNRISMNHTVHCAGFFGGFFVSLLLSLMAFLVVHLIDPSITLFFCQKRRNGGSSALEFGDCDVDDSLKDEAWFENKMVDMMILEEPQNMSQTLESIEVSALLQASTHLEEARLQIHKALVAALLSRGDGRLLEVIIGQMMGAEGRLKEQLEARMAALSTQCNRETRDAMETEHHRQRQEQEEAEQLCQQAEQQIVLHCSLLLEKLHKLSQSWLQRHLLVQHEEASARIQREITEQRRVELHKIFCEELEEATRLGEIDQNTASRLQHQYFSCQDLLEDTIDEVEAHQRFVLSERQAQRSFLVQSLQSLHSLICETFSNFSRALDDWFSHISRLSCVSAEQLKALCDRAQHQVVILRQRLEEALTDEKRALRGGLLQRRRELLCDMLRVHRQQQKALLSSPLPPDEAGLLQMFHSWWNLLSSHCSEFSELIKRLDEEAATDIRKVTTRLLEGTVSELRAIQPSVAQSLQAMLSPADRRLIQADSTALIQDPAQSDRLQQDGQTALLTLNTTRDQLQCALQREMKEQRQTRDKCRAFFRHLCSCQLSLSEADLLQLKQEFLKCFSVMDQGLMLPPAVLKTKLHCALEEWRSTQESLMIQDKLSKGKRGLSKHRPGSELQRFQKSLNERVSLFEKLAEQEMDLRDKVLEEMRVDRHLTLLSQTCVLSSRLISGQCEKVQSRSSALQMWTALMSLRKILIQQFTQRDNMANSIHMYWEGLTVAEEQFHKDQSSLLDSSPVSDQLHIVSDGSESSDSETVFQLKSDCRMVSILQGALHKREQLLSVLTQSCEQWRSSSQVTEELKEQLELRRLQEFLHQELQFVSDLLKVSEIPPDVLKELFRLLLPCVPESKRLCVTEALSPKQSSADPQRSGLSSIMNFNLAVNLRKDVISKAAVEAPACLEQSTGLDEKRQDLLQKLLPLACAPPLIIAHRQNVQPSVPRSDPTSQDPQTGPLDSLKTGSDKPSLDPGLGTSLSPGSDLSHDCHGDRDDPTVRLFVFRDRLPSASVTGSITRKRKRNFLNFKKNSVLPTHQL